MNELEATLWDKFITFFLVTIPTVLGWAWHKINTLDEKVNKLELKVSEQYVSNNRFKSFEDKIDERFDILQKDIKEFNTTLIAFLQRVK